MGAKIVVKRNSDRDIKIRGLHILLDGSQVADLKFRAEIELPVLPGTHELKVTNTLFSKTADVELSDGDCAEFVVGNQAPGFLGALFLALGIVPYRVFLQRVEASERGTAVKDAVKV